MLCKDHKNYKVLYVKRGKKYFSFKCPHCGKQMRRVYIGATFVCGSDSNKCFVVKEIKRGKGN